LHRFFGRFPDLGDAVMHKEFRAPDRRLDTRGPPPLQPHRPQLVAMILGTYREMPGLCLHLNQAGRLFGITTNTCRIVLEDLVKRGKLAKTADGQYKAGDLKTHSRP
jgi:hypothetical protein